MCQLEDLRGSEIHRWEIPNSIHLAGIERHKQSLCHLLLRKRLSKRIINLPTVLPQLRHYLSPSLVISILICKDEVCWDFKGLTVTSRSWFGSMLKQEGLGSLDLIGVWSQPGLSLSLLPSVPLPCSLCGARYLQLLLQCPSAWVRRKTSGLLFFSSCNPSWPWVYYVAKTLELTVLLTLLPKCWDGRHAPGWGRNRTDIYFALTYKKLRGRQAEGIS